MDGRGIMEIANGTWKRRRKSNLDVTDSDLCESARHPDLETDERSNVWRRNEKTSPETEGCIAGRRQKATSAREMWLRTALTTSRERRETELGAPPFEESPIVGRERVYRVRRYIQPQFLVADTDGRQTKTVDESTTSSFPHASSNPSDGDQNDDSSMADSTIGLVVSVGETSGSSTEPSSIARDHYPTASQGDFIGYLLPSTTGLAHALPQNNGKARETNKSTGATVSPGVDANPAERVA
ncbi:hypothetical protein F4779DRAFT_619373 [Xylariaceae sp. FL0662B]|nr:hypothetical protein F4779DRAFT_619373 [Xylariaceae sp. FL0662B]